MNHASKIFPQFYQTMAKVKFTEPLKFLNVVGVNPLNYSNFSLFRRVVSLGLFLVVIILGLLELLLHFDGLETCSRASEAMIVQYQLIIKIAILLKHKKDLVVLIDQTKKFWPLDKFGQQAKLERPHRLLKTFFFVYKTIMFLMTVQYILRKFVSKSNKPLAISYGEKQGLSPEVDHLYFVLHSTTTFVILYAVTGFDGLFFYLIGHVLTELKLVEISYRLSHNRKDKFLETIQHHASVLRFVKKLNKIYSQVLLNQHMSCLFGICFGLFLVSKDGIPPDLGHITKYVPYVISFITQTFTFCFIGSLLISWSLQVPDAIFYNGWSKHHAYKYKTEKIIAIIRGQRAARLTLGGFGDLNLESFNLVVKNAFSFFTFVNAMNEK
ncbi:odorant receptor 22c-like isoform X2 [Tribolium madens]|uniref:odorant receptor 22c-like isoform X2 n=1 Tax=Tribolium madens TaxID=41895 RepID=UPI001CF737FA|nr:odorant receptor 22c-like isoform X2 [Tribolium madens]